MTSRYRSRCSVPGTVYHAPYFIVTMWTTRKIAVIDPVQIIVADAGDLRLMPPAHCLFS